ncbi:AAA domain-containing protein [Rhizobium ruizarguesonis]
MADASIRMCVQFGAVLRRKTDAGRGLREPTNSFRRCRAGFRTAVLASAPRRECKFFDANLVSTILEGQPFWVDRNGESKPLTLSDIVIITPYNAQVMEIQKRLPTARVGTVDKFQGQEAPLAIYSTATSSYADAPRGMEFLYSANRFNVAISRAKCLAILVGSPEIFEPECKTPRQMQLANAFCRYLELSTLLN